MASKATLALNVGEWFLRGLLLMVLLLSRASSPIGWRRVSTYRRVLISEATSDLPLTKHSLRDSLGSISVCQRRGKGKFMLVVSHAGPSAELEAAEFTFEVAAAA